MSYTEEDARMDAYYADLQRQFEEDLKGQARSAVQGYLARYGDVIDERVKACLVEASSLLKAGYCGPALCTSAIGIELMIRFMLVGPLVQGAFLSAEWAEVLTDRVATGRTADDRAMLPAVLRQWGLDVTKVQCATSDTPVWEFTVSQLFPRRNDYVHRYDTIDPAVAAVGVECAEAFRYQIVGAVAKQMGFTLETTGKWCRIFHPAQSPPAGESGVFSLESVEEFAPADPFAAKAKK